MITFKISGVDKVLANFESMPSVIKKNLSDAMLRVVTELQVHVKRDKLSGQVLNVKTGRLRRSINQEIRIEGDKITGIVGTNVEYGKLWELGGTERTGAGAQGGPRTLKGKALETYFSKHPPGSKNFGPRSFLGSALEDMKPSIITELKACERPL